MNIDDAGRELRRKLKALKEMYKAHIRSKKDPRLNKLMRTFRKSKLIWHDTSRMNKILSGEEEYDLSYSMRSDDSEFLKKREIIGAFENSRNSRQILSNRDIKRSYLSYRLGNVRESVRAPKSPTRTKSRDKPGIDTSIRHDFGPTNKVVSRAQTMF